MMCCSRRGRRAWSCGVCSIAALLTSGVAGAQQAIGMTLVTWVRNNIVAPLAMLLIMVTIGAAFVRPEMAKGAGYIAIMAVVLLFIMSTYGTLVSMFQ